MLALQRGHQDAALPLVRTKDGVPADGSDEEGVGLAGVEHVRITLEDLANRLRVGKHHELSVARDVKCEGIAEAAVALVE